MYMKKNRDIIAKQVYIALIQLDWCFHGVFMSSHISSGSWKAKEGNQNQHAISFSCSCPPFSPLPLHSRWY